MTHISSLLFASLLRCMCMHDMVDGLPLVAILKHDETAQASRRRQLWFCVVSLESNWYFTCGLLFLLYSKYSSNIEVQFPESISFWARPNLGFEPETMKNNGAIIRRSAKPWKPRKQWKRWETLKTMIFYLNPFVAPGSPLLTSCSNIKTYPSEGQGCYSWHPLPAFTDCGRAK
jgi:hypothetical protein